MLISEKHKKIVLNLKSPARVTTVIPTAKTLQYKGRTLVAVPHNRDEVKVLKNLGIAAPEPVRHYYGWPGQFDPFHAQRETAAMLTMEPHAYVLNDMGCVDAGTEYLSRSGWRRIDQYEGGEVAQYNPASGEVTFVQPTEYVKRPCARMIHFKTKYGVDQVLSPEHRVLLEATDSERMEVCSAADLFDRQNQWLAGTARKKVGRIGWSKAGIPNTFTYSGAGMSLTDAELRLQVAVIADGHFPSMTGGACHVRLKKERKKERLRNLLEAAAVEFKEVPCLPSGFTRFSFYAPRYWKHYGSEFWQCSQHQLSVIADEVMHWDGSISVDKPTQRFSTTIRDSADFIQFAFCATGRTARVLETRRVRRGREEVEFTVQVRATGKPLGLAGLGADGTKLTNAREVASSDGYKYCFMVPSTFLVFRRNGCVFLSGNTGKTMSVLWSYDYLREIGVLRRMLVVAPLSTLDDTWLNTVHGQFFHLNAVVLHGTRERRLRLLKDDYDVYIINHDGLKTAGLVEAIRARGDIDLVVLDELAVFRNTGTDRWKAADALCNPRKDKKTPLPRPWVWGLTGTPMPNAPTDAFAQCKLVTPHTVPQYFGRFRDMVMRQAGPYTWLPRDNAIDIVHRAMTPAVRFSMEDCVDLPEQLLQTREVGMSAEQLSAYNDMLRRLKAEYEGGQITAANEAVKASKLLQICCIAKGTPVLTDRGWLPIEAVTRHDHVWDGEAWVQCGGSIYQGDKPTIECAGVRMTPDHEVLTAHGWASAEEVVYGNAGKGLDRAEVRLPGSFTQGRNDIGEDTVSAGVQVRVECGAGTDNPGKTPVYDVLNCGPRQRFVVRGEHGELSIVHNCGAAYTNDGGAALIPATPRLNELEEIIEQASAKVIVFVPFTEALSQVAAFVERRWGVLTMHGEVSRTKRAEVFSQFKRDPHIRVLVAEPRTMSHGLTLVEANVIVWFAPTTSNDTYGQACARVRRPGQTKTTLIVHMCGSPVERKMYARLASKQKMQGDLLDMFKETKNEALTA